MISIKTFVFNLFSENSFIVWDNESNESIILDPGCSNTSEESAVDNFILQNNLKVKYLINTHCHIDHILGNAYIKQKYHPEFLAPEEDVFLLEMMLDQAGYFGINAKSSPHPDKFLKEDLLLYLGDSKIDLLFTPGHSPGGYCLYFSKESFCITGDVLFKESIGRTDLWGGDYDTLINSINSKLLILPASVKIFPGHGEDSTIGYEKNHNPFLS